MWWIVGILLPFMAMMMIAGALTWWADGRFCRPAAMIGIMLSASYVIWAFITLIHYLNIGLIWSIIGALLISGVQIILFECTSTFWFDKYHKNRG